jgi:hypothetical protein
MKCILEIDNEPFPALLKLFIFGAPHVRQMDQTPSGIWLLQTYRSELIASAKKIQLKTPIDYPIDLYALFIDPTTPDLDNLIMALYQAMDAKAFKGPSLLSDDGMIQKVTMSKFYPNGPVKNENRVP